MGMESRLPLGGGCGWGLGGQPKGPGSLLGRGKHLEIDGGECLFFPWIFFFFHLSEMMAVH